MRTAPIIALCFLLAGSQPSLAEETVFQGKNTSEWIQAILDRPNIHRFRRDTTPPLVELGLGREEALPILRKLLRDGPTPVRVAVAREVLGRMDPRGRDLYADPASNACLRELLRLLDDRSPGVRAAAIEGLGYMESWSSTSPVRPKSDTMEADVPNSASFSEPGRCGPLLREAERRIRDLRGDGDPDVARTASQVLDLRFNAGVDSAAPESEGETVARLLEELWGRDQRAAERAASALARHPETAQKIVPQLVEATEKRAFLRVTAIGALGLMGPAAKASLPRLQQLMRTGFGPERPVAALAVWRVTGESVEPLSVLAAALEYEPEAPRVQGQTARLRGVRGLGRMGGVAGSLCDQIEERLGDTWSPVRQSALVALRRCCSDRGRVVAAHVRALGDADEYVRVTAARGLGELGAPPPEALAGLVRMLDDSLRYGLLQAIHALGMMGETASEGVPAIARQLESPTYSIRREAAWALAAIGDAGGRALSESANSEHLWLRGEIAGELGPLASQRADCRTKLTELLADPEVYVRLEAAVALARSGSRSPKLLEVVLSACESADRFDAEWAVEALLRLGPSWVRSWLAALAREPARRSARIIEIIGSLPEAQRGFVREELSTLQTDIDQTLASAAVRAAKLLRASK